MDNREIYKYKDIINLPHHVSSKHPHMDLESRAAQFAPFAALTGFENSVKETARLTEEKIELDEAVKKELDRKLNYIEENISKKIKVSINYFVPDERKSGGKYVTVTEIVKKIDNYNKTIIMENNITIPIEEIKNIEIQK